MRDIESAFLLGVLAARAEFLRRTREDRPAAILAIDHGLAQHPSHEGAAASAAAGAGADSGALADLLEGFGTGLDGFDHGTFADLVADAGGFEVFDDRLLSGFLF
jgi:hypothetical protein